MAEPTAEQTGTSPGTGRRANATSFKPGNAGGKRLKKPPVPALPEPEGEVGDGAGVMLRDMRWAYRNLGVRCEGTPQQELFRKELRDTPAKFRAELQKLEKEFRAGREGSGEGGSAPVLAADAGEERVQELIRRLLKLAKGTGDGGPGRGQAV